MRELRILLAGGLTPDKFEKKVKELKELLEKEEIKAVITAVNTYEYKDLSSFEDNNDLILAAGNVNLDSKLPIINGMGLMYAWMDRDKMLKEIVSVDI